MKTPAKYSETFFVQHKPVSTYRMRFFVDFDPVPAARLDPAFAMHAKGGGLITNMHTCVGRFPDVKSFYCLAVGKSDLLFFKTRQGLQRTARLLSVETVHHA